VSIDASPPAQPPQMSPDGNWVWDGSQWQPVTGVEPIHEGVFAAYAHKVEAADQAVGVAQPGAVGVPVQVPAPAMDDPYPAPAPAADYYPATDPVVPLWQQQKSSGKSVYLYVGGAVVLFLMVLIVLNSISLVSLPFIGTSSKSQQGAKPPPSANPVRSEFGRADDFMKGSFVPALLTLEQVMPRISNCNGTLSNSCIDAMNAIDDQMKNFLSVIDHRTIPLCIAPQVKRYRSDLASMEAGLQLGLKGYKDNQDSEVTNGVNQYTRGLPNLPGDFTALDKAVKTQCSTDLEGP
jgi:hypothetical protein